MRKEKIIKDEYYHILNRGNNKQPIFADERDMARFLFFIIHLQSPKRFLNISRQVNCFIKNGLFNVSKKEIDEIIENRYVELVSFILMPNHFHLIVKEAKEGGTSDYMKRVLGGHTRYFNVKNKILGHLFQGPFGIVHVKDDPQLLYLSAYVHNNVRELNKWTEEEHAYPWSSYQDFIKENRWGELLKPDIILEQFPNKDKYKFFVEKSGAKEKQK